MNKNVDARTETEAKKHYLLYGKTENLLYSYQGIPSSFDWEAYVALNKNVDADTETEAKKHYLLYGKTENLLYSYQGIPSSFDWTIYLALNSDVVATTEIEAKKHYLLYGKKKNLLCSLTTVPGKFEWNVYTMLYDDLYPTTETDAKIHYLLYGKSKGRIYSLDGLPRDFNWKSYVYLNEDLTFNSEYSAIEHYLRCGIRESRMYSLDSLPSDFNSSDYLEINPSIKISDYRHLAIDVELCAKKHYIIYGMAEKLQYSYTQHLPPDFEWKKYVELNRDLQFTTEKEALGHYSLIGRHEHRPYNINTICVFHCGDIDIFNSIIEEFPQISNMRLIITFHKDEYEQILTSQAYHLNIIHLMKVENKGMDCGPFLLVVKYLYTKRHLYNDKTTFLKIHTKSLKKCNGWTYTLIHDIIHYENTEYNIPVQFGSNKYIYPGDKSVNMEYMKDIMIRRGIQDNEYIESFFDTYHSKKLCSSRNTQMNQYIDLYPSEAFYKTYEPDLKNTDKLTHWRAHGIHEPHRKSNVNYIKKWATRKNMFVAGTVFGFNSKWLGLFDGYNINHEYSILETGYVNNHIPRRIHAWEYYFGLITYMGKGKMYGISNGEVTDYSQEFIDKNVSTYSIINVPYNKSKIAIFMLIPGSNPSSGGYRTLLTYVDVLNRAGYSVDMYFGLNIPPDDSQLQDQVSRIDAYGMPLAITKHKSTIHTYIEQLKLYDEIKNLSFNNYYIGLKCQRKYDILIANAWQISEAVYLNKSSASSLCYIIQDREELFNDSPEFKKFVLKTYHPEFVYYCITQYLANYFTSHHKMKNVVASRLGIHTNMYYDKHIPREKSVVIPYYGSTKPGRLPVLVGKIIDILAENEIRCYVFPHTYKSDSEYVVNLGTLNVADLNDLYNKTRVGIVFSNTNPSRLGFEMYGSGMNVIEYDSEFTEYDMPASYFTKIKNEDNILSIVRDLFEKVPDMSFLSSIDIRTDHEEFLTCIEELLPENEFSI